MVHKGSGVCVSLLLLASMSKDTHTPKRERRPWAEEEGRTRGGGEAGDARGRMQFWTGERAGVTIMAPCTTSPWHLNGLVISLPTLAQATTPTTLTTALESRTTGI